MFKKIALALSAAAPGRRSGHRERARASSPQLWLHQLRLCLSELWLQLRLIRRTGLWLAYGYGYPSYGYSNYGYG